MGFAPDTPSTETLQAMHSLTTEGRQKVYEKRLEAADALRFGRKLLAIVGPCAMTDDREEILDENRRMSAFAMQNDIVLLHRLPPWKPRTNPADWHGLETTDPEEAHRITVEIAEQSGNLAMEFGDIRHIRRYIGQATLGWRGSRNNQQSLLHELAQHDQSLPLAVKNGMNGSTDDTSHDVRRASWLRDADDASPITLIFRGGADLRTPDAWMDEYVRTIDRTHGSFIVDVAHGGEQAHDPEEKFEKSALGQIACLHTIRSVASATRLLPHGVMIESSDVPSPTDPVVPLEQAFEELEELARIHRQVKKM